MRRVATRRAVIGGAIAIALIASSFSGSAGAVVTAATGNIEQLASVPSTIALNKLESATSAFAFDEQQAVTLSSPVTVNYVVPGPQTVGFVGGVIPAGTVVSSHVVHSDPITGTGKTRRVGTASFDGDIIGVITATTRLVETDFLGVPGTTYPGGFKARGFEGSVDRVGHSKSDRYSISPDLRTINLDFKTYSMDQIRILTSPGDTLQTTIDDSPDPVTEGKDVQYTLTVKNLTAGTIPAHVVNTLPAGATLKYAPPSCTGTTVIDCDLGSVTGGAEAVVKIVVTSPMGAGSMTTTATATPGVNSTASETTTIEAATDGVVKGWVMPGQSLATTGHDPATVDLPNTSTGAPILINQSTGSFCGGPCATPTTSVAPFTGYENAAAPARLVLEWNFKASDNLLPNTVTAAATAYFKTLYLQDSGNPSVGTPILDCAVAGVAAPNPCLNTKILDEAATHGDFFVRFEILFTGQAITVGRAA